VGKVSGGVKNRRLHATGIVIVTMHGHHYRNHTGIVIMQSGVLDTEYRYEASL
jgi:hypothetical protein